MRVTNILKTLSLLALLLYTYSIFLAYLRPENVSVWSGLWSICR